MYRLDLNFNFDMRINYANLNEECEFTLKFTELSQDQVYFIGISIVYFDYDDAKKYNM